MTSAWDQAEKMAEEHANSGGIFVRLKNTGDKVIGAFCGEPYAREVIWTGERYEEFDDKNNSAHQGKRPSLRVMLNFYVPTDGVMKVIEGGTAWFRDVVKVRDKYGLEKWLFEIERHGDSGDPKTKYSILPEEKIDDPMRARIAAAELNDLQSVDAGSDEDKGSKKSSNAAGPIDVRVALELVEGLKQLPRSDVDAFLAEFGVQRVRELEAKDEGAARAFIDQRLAKQSQPEEVDPFA